MIDVKETLQNAEERMEMAAMYLEEELNRVRAGRANVAILDGVRVESYGSRVPLNQVANISTPDARTIAIKPWDRKQIRDIEKAIMDSDVGITPENNGLGIPQPTEERRRDLVKQCNKIAEKAKVEVRNVRADIKEKLKKAIKDGLSEDNEKDAENELQKVHDNVQQAWNDFVEYYSPLISLRAKDFGLTQLEYEDLRQNVCLTVFKKDLTGQYDEKIGHFRTFLRKVISNCAIDIIRKRSSAVPIENASQIPEETEDKFEEEWRHFIYEKALQIVRQNCDNVTYMAFDLYARKGMPVKDVARTLQISEDQVFQAKSRTLKRLKETIADLERTEDSWGTEDTPSK